MQNDTNVFEQSRDLTFNLPHSLNHLFGQHSEIRITLSHRQTLQLPFRGTGRDRFSIRVTRGNDTIFETEQVFNYFDSTRVTLQEVETRAHAAQVFPFILLIQFQFRTLPEKVQQLFQALQIRPHPLIPISNKLRHFNRNTLPNTVTPFSFF